MILFLLYLEENISNICLVSHSNFYNKMLDLKIENADMKLIEKNKLIDFLNK